MIQIGEYNRLIALKFIGAGMLLKDRDSDEVALLPAREVPREMEKGSEVEAFVYQDREGRGVATLKRPKVTLNKFGYLKVKEVNDLGAFLDWGIQKDLMVPFAAQAKRMAKGLSYIVYLEMDQITNRLVATSRIHRFIKKDGINLEINERVNLLVVDRSPMGYKVIINDLYQGMLFKNEVYEQLRIGRRMIGFVKLVRADGKVDVVLQEPGYAGVEPNVEKLLEEMKRRGGFLPLTDKSDPEAIKDLMGMSKKTFKKAVGALYKQQMIRISSDGLFLTDKGVI